MTDMVKAIRLLLAIIAFGMLIGPTLLLGLFLDRPGQIALGFVLRDMVRWVGGWRTKWL